MLRLLFFLSILSIAHEAFADNAEKAPEELPVKEKIEALSAGEPQETAAAPKEEITYTVEKEIVALPKCDNEKLLAKTKEYVAAFFKEQADNKGTPFRRRRHFIEKNLNMFGEENVANYKTASARPVSDIIIDLKANHNVLEENMRLCKNQSKNPTAENLYILVYPAPKGYTVRLINLPYTRNVNQETSFVYE